MWTRLSPLTPYDWHAPETVKRRNTLSKRIQKLLDARAELDRITTAVSNVPLEEVKPEDLFQGSSPACSRFSLLQAELTLRTELAEWCVLALRDAEAAIAAFSGRYPAKQAEIRERLVSIGYHDVPVTSLDPGKITPGMVLSHPEVHALRQEQESVRQQPEVVRTMNRENDRALETVRTELEELRRRAAHGL